MDCLRLLATRRLGRIGITVQALPVMLPVDFRVLDQAIVFRTIPGTKLDAATAVWTITESRDRRSPEFALLT